MRAYCFVFCYLLIALGLEKGMLPQLHTATHWSLRPLLDLQLLAMAGVLAGLLRGELPGLVVALVAAVCAGMIPGSLGPNIVSFTLVAWTAGWLARHLRLQGTPSRFMTIALLLLLERSVWTVVHWLVWRDGPLTLPWPVLPSAMLTAVLGAVIIKLINRFSRRSAFSMN
jgi:hypothetical protein